MDKREGRLTEQEYLQALEDIMPLMLEDPKPGSREYYKLKRLATAIEVYETEALQADEELPDPAKKRKKGIDQRGGDDT